MADRLYSGTPPTPDGYNELDMEIMRRYLPESLVQILIKAAATGLPQDVTAAAGRSMFRASNDVAKRIQASENGGDWRGVLEDPLKLDVRDFGTDVGTGDETADTDALLAVFAEVTNSFDTHTGGRSANIYIPRAGGTFRRYYLAEEIEFMGGASLSHRIYGDGFDAEPGGTVIQWTGDDSDDVTMLHTFGLCNSTIENLSLVGDGKAGRLLHVESGQILGVGFPSSTNNIFRNIGFGQVKGAAGICFAIGSESEDTFQCDNSSILKCSFAGFGGFYYGIGVKQLQAGNCKNWHLEDAIMLYLETGIWSGGSGAQSWKKVRGAEIGTFLRTGGGCREVVESIQVEGLDHFIDSSVGTNPGQLDVRSCDIFMAGNYTQLADDDDVCIEHQGILKLTNNNFYNNSVVADWLPDHLYDSFHERVKNGGKLYEQIGTGTSAHSGGPTTTLREITDGTVTWRYVGPVQDEAQGRLPYIVTGGTLTNAAVFSFGNNYSRTIEGDYPPVIDGSGNNVFGSDQINSYAQTTYMQSWCFGDKGGYDGGGFVDLKSSFGRPIEINTNMAVAPHIYGRVLRNGSQNQGDFAVEFTYDKFSAAAHNFEIPVNKYYRGRLIGTYLEVTEAFAGTGLTALTAKLSTSPNGGEMIAATDILTGSFTGIIGTVVSELNTAAGKFWEPATCLPGGGKFIDDSDFIYLRLDGDVDLSLLTAGKIVVILEYARIFSST